MNDIFPPKRKNIVVRTGSPTNLELACAGCTKSSFGLGPVMKETTQFLRFACSIEPRVPAEGPIPFEFSANRDCPHCGKVFRLELQQRASFDGTVDALGYRNLKRIEAEVGIAFMIGIGVIALLAGIYTFIIGIMVISAISMIFFAGCLIIGCGMLVQKFRCSQDPTIDVGGNPRFTFAGVLWPGELIPMSGIVSVKLTHVRIRDPQNEKSSIRLVKSGEYPYAPGQQHTLYFKEKKVSPGSEYYTPACLNYSVDLPISE